MTESVLTSISYFYTIPFLSILSSIAKKKFIHEPDKALLLPFFVHFYTFITNNKHHRLENRKNYPDYFAYNTSFLVGIKKNKKLMNNLKNVWA